MSEKFSENFFVLGSHLCWLVMYCSLVFAFMCWMHSVVPGTLNLDPEFANDASIVSAFIGVVFLFLWLKTKRYIEKVKNGEMTYGQAFDELWSSMNK